MVAVSGGLIFIGYQLMVYGWSQVRGSNAGFFDILWPGRYRGAFPDPPANYGTTPNKAPGPAGATGYKVTVGPGGGLTETPVTGNGKATG